VLILPVGMLFRRKFLLLLFHSNSPRSSVPDSLEKNQVLMTLTHRSLTRLQLKPSIRLIKKRES